MLRFVPLLLAAVLAPAALAQPQTVLFPGQDDADLRAALVADYKPSSVLSSAASKDRMYDTVWRTTEGGDDGVEGLYTGFFVAFDCDPSCDPSQDVFNAPNENTLGLNQEHIWPRSEGTDGTQAERDLHGLAPTWVRANSDRGSLPFDEIPDAQTDDWYRENSVQTDDPPLAERDAYSERDRNVAFEPREEAKGDVARAMFYVATVYEGTVDMGFFDGQKETLLDWHYADPVDPAEYDRTFRAADFQQDLPNPFVLDSTLARRAFFPDIVVNPPVAVTAVVGGSTTVGPGGGSIGYTVTLTNPAAGPQTVEAWVMVLLPDDTLFGPVKGPTAVALPGGGVIGPVPLALNVPSAAPAGVYVVSVRAGTYPAPFTAEDSFIFEKTGAVSAEAEAAPAAFALEAPFPNPAAGAVTVGLVTPESGDARVEVTDLLGRRVATLVDGPLAAGRHIVSFDTSGLPSGVYLVRMGADGFTAVQRVTLTR